MNTQEVIDEIQSDVARRSYNLTVLANNVSSEDEKKRLVAKRESLATGVDLVLPLMVEGRFSEALEELGNRANEKPGDEGAGLRLAYDVVARAARLHQR